MHKRLSVEALSHLLASIPQPDAAAPFRLKRLEYIPIPHPYMITSRHVAIAADEFSGSLGEAAIERAEAKGATCGICRGRYPYSAHISQLTLFIGVPQNSDLNAVPGLGDYLVSLKPWALENGVEGFAFPLLTDPNFNLGEEK